MQMSEREARALVQAVCTPIQIKAFSELLQCYEAEQTEEAITSSDREVARNKVLAVREIRALLKPPRGEAGQA